MTESELMEFYGRNRDFREYIGRMRRTHPELSEEGALRKVIARNVAEQYRESEHERSGS